MTCCMTTPIWAGDLDTVTPAASKALILSVAVPLPPDMIAPAWPILLPGGAVRPIDETHIVIAVLINDLSGYRFALSDDKATLE